MTQVYAEYLDKDLSQNEVERKVVNEELGSKHNLYKLDASQRKYDRQFFSMYQYRYKHLKERVIESATEKWGNGSKTIDGQTIEQQDKILDIRSNKLCWVVGTVYCDLKNKLDILKDVENGEDDVLPAVPPTYVGEGGESESTVMLEDESGRAILHHDEYLRKNFLVTGCIVAVLGIEVQAGVFEIMDVAFPSMSIPKPLPGAPVPGKVVIVSGLEMGHADDDLRLELFKQYLAGELGSDTDKEAVSEVTRVIIAGNSVKPIHESSRESSKRDFVTTNNYGSKNISRFNTESLEKFDHFIHDLLVHVSVSVMPGNKDPAEICLPQQALHKSILHSNYPFMNDDRLQILTNPQWFSIGGVSMLGTSGQNITDILRYIPSEHITEKTVMAAMLSTIKWQNIAPTAPDTLYCYPYDDFDPFVLQDEAPRVYFVGNQQRFDSQVYEYEAKGSKHTMRLVSIPSFSSTGQFVVLDTATLEAEVVTIDI